MSFLSSIYSKVFSASPKKYEESCSWSDLRSRFTEELDNEDGFVLYTANQQNKRYKQSEQSPAGGITTYEKLQQSCTNSSGSILDSSSYPESSMQQKKDYTFLTVSDVPVQLSKMLQTVLNTNQGSFDTHRRPLDMEQYNYDFSLEKTVVLSLEGHS